MVKFELPSLDSEEEDSTKEQAPNFSLPYDELEQTDNPVQFTFKKRNPTLINLDQKDDEYANIFNRKTSTANSQPNDTVLNLEDLDDEYDKNDEWEADAKDKGHGFTDSDGPKVNEKTYVKLLSAEDKQDLKEMGIERSSKQTGDDDLVMDMELQDERLALGANEISLLAKKKRQEIEQLIMANDDPLHEQELLAEEWKQLNKISGVKMSILPRLQPEVSWQQLYDSVKETIRTSRARTEHSTDSLRIRALQSKMERLTLRQKELIDKLTELAS